MLREILSPYGDALAIWDRFLSGGDKDKEKAKEHWVSAQKYFEGKLYNRALKDMGIALTLNPGYGQEAMDLMQAFMGQGNDEMALSVGLALLKMDPKNHELMNRLGNALRNTESFAKAKKLYTHALKVSPHYDEAKYNLAACSFHIATADSALISQTRKVEVYTEFRRYEFMGNRDGFCPVPNQVLEEDSKSSKKKGKDEEEEKEEELSEEALAAMVEGMAQQLKVDVEESGGEMEALYNLGLFYDINNMAELALTNYRLASEKEPDNRMINNNMAVALIVHERNAKAAEGLLLKNLEKHPFDRTTVLNTALLYKAAGKQFQTLKYYVYLGELMAVSLGHFETDEAEVFAQDLFQRRKYLEAVPMYEALGREKKTPFWYEKLAVMYLNQKKEDKLVLTWKRLLQIDPKHEEANKKLTEMAAEYETAAHEDMEKDRIHSAIENMTKAVKIQETPERWLELVQLYQDDGEEILADNALRRWKKLTGEDEGSSSGKKATAN